MFGCVLEFETGKACCEIFKGDASIKTGMYEIGFCQKLIKMSQKQKFETIVKKLIKKFNKRKYVP